MKRLLCALIMLALLVPAALADEDRLLVVGGESVADAKLHAYALSAGVTVRRAESVQDLTDQFAQAMATRDGSVDLYFLSTRACLRNIKVSGFYRPLEGSAVLAEQAELLYPAFLRALTDQGHLVAWPVQVNPIMGDASVKRRLEALGFDYPTTFDDYLDTCAALQEADWWSDASYRITSLHPFDRQHVMEQFIRLYIFEQQASHDGAVSFDTPDFRRVMARIAAEVPDTAVSGDGWDFTEALMDMDFIFDRVSERMIAPLQITPGAQTAVDVDACVAIVNPFSARQEEAVAFLEYLAQLHDEESYTYMRLSPYQDAQASEAIARQEAELEALRASLEAEPENAADLRLRIEDAEKALATLRGSAYVVSPAALENYAALAEGFVIAEADDLRSDEAIRQSIRMYADGLLSVDRLVDRLEEHAFMVMDE